MTWWQRLADWGQNVLVLLESMKTWQQGLLIVFIMVLVGLTILLPIVNLIMRLLKKKFASSGGLGDWRTVSPPTTSNSEVNDPLEELMRKHQALRASAKLELSAQSQSVADEPAKDPQKIAPDEATKVPQKTAPAEPTRNPQRTAPAEKQVRLTAPHILEEIRHNLTIAVRPWDGTILPFETEAWDNNRDKLNFLPAHVQDDLDEAYVDMRLANDIAWLSKEVGRTNPELAESYVRLCSQIAARLRKMVPAGELVNLTKR